MLYYILLPKSNIEVMENVSLSINILKKSVVCVALLMLLRF